MHEVSIVQSLIDLIESHGQEYRLVKVTKIVVRIGEQVSVCQESLRFAFEAVSHGTIAEGAELVLELIPGRVRCNVCGCETLTKLPAFMECPRCGGSVALVAGRELDLQTIEGEQAEC